MIMNTSTNIPTSGFKSISKILQLAHILETESIEFSLDYDAPEYKLKIKPISEDIRNTTEDTLTIVDYWKDVKYETDSVIVMYNKILKLVDIENTKNKL